MRCLNEVNLDGGVRYIQGAKVVRERDSYVELGSLEQGTYYVFVEMDWDDNTTSDNRSFNVTCYGQGQTIFKTDDALLYEKHSVLEKAFKSKAEQGLPGIVKTDMSKRGAPLITKYECNTAPEGYNYVIIQSND